MSSWIEFAEKSPKHDEKILCSTSNGDIIIARYDKNTDRVISDSFNGANAIAWMKLPKNYDRIDLGDHVNVIRNHGSFPGVVVGKKKTDYGIKYCVLCLVDSSVLSMSPYELLYCSRGELVKTKGVSKEFAMAFNEVASSLRYWEND